MDSVLVDEETDLEKLGQHFSECCLWTSCIHITWEFVRNDHSQAPSQTYWIRNSGCGASNKLHKPIKWFPCMLNVEDPRPTQNHTDSRIQIPAVWLQSPAVNLCAMNITGHRHKEPSPSYNHPLQMSRLSICWQMLGCWKCLVRFIRRSKCSTLRFFTSLFFMGLCHIPHRNEDFLLSKHSTLITRALPEAPPWPYGIFVSHPKSSLSNTEEWSGQ